ncbi:MAG: PhoH family protein [Planctomycetaceae bacterium]|jgi:phosphate starvation-inducible PhoH-like protein|nr:PhoH family protein [Planctomycetaceae bacterium]
MSDALVSILDHLILQKVFGPSDEYLRMIRRALGVQATIDAANILLKGDAESVRKAALLLEQLQRYVKSHGELARDDVQRAISEILQGDKISDAKPLDVYGTKRVHPKTAGQARYVETLREKEVVICTGPAGTGKTYLAVARAVEALRSEGIKKIVLVRPAVEAGESLGFLPGDLNAKINPYLRPLFDALSEMIDRDMLRRALEEERVEVVPLAYMRGRTLNNAYIILDEAQNATVAQMKMFLTRMGFGSRIAVCGDVTQVDLPPHKRSGLVDALIRLKGIDGIGTVRLETSDVVRHNLVQQIINAYEQTGRVVFDHQYNDHQRDERQYDEENQNEEKE